MEYVHHCVFCGWSRPGASPTILSPVCESCGCALRSSSASELRAELEHAAPPAPRISLDALRIAALTVGALVMFAAVATGWRAGGIWIAVVGLGLGGLASLSLPYPARR
jgi:hypothetical protein